jgi:hypothetical protein
VSSTDSSTTFSIYFDPSIYVVACNDPYNKLKNEPLKAIYFAIIIEAVGFYFVGNGQIFSVFFKVLQVTGDFEHRICTDLELEIIFGLDHVRPYMPFPPIPPTVTLNWTKPTLMI